MFDVLFDVPFSKFMHQITQPNESAVNIHDNSSIYPEHDQNWLLTGEI